METLTKSEVALRARELIEHIMSGEVFIHPTDTIYGIGCNATDEKAVKKVRRLKERNDAPFSVWAPSKDWIRENCVITGEAQQWLEQLPGPQTLILRLKNKKAVAPNVNPGNGTLGVRMPNHWFHKMVEHLGVPIVTTSANRSGRKFMTSIDDLDTEIRNGVRFCVYEGEKRGRPSKIVHLIGEVKVQVR